MTENSIKYTDDCQLFEKLNKRVYLSEGKYTNIKITTPEDLAIAGAIVSDGKSERKA